MRVLIFGGKGMLGHKLYQTMAEPLDAWTTVRGEARELERFGFYCPDRVVGGVDALDSCSIERAFNSIRPNAVVNCIGIVKQQPLAKDPAACNVVNARLPHILAALCREHQARLIHISTDCVFSGKKGGYREDDITDAKDIYGRSKAQGEVQASNAITLRTSIIGRELSEGFGLVEWFLSTARQKPAQISGYTQAFFSGLTTHELSRIIQRVLLQHPSLCGIYQVSGEPIDKASLLNLIKREFGLSVDITRIEEPSIDRTLDSTRFRQTTGYRPPSWPDMIRELALDPTPYDTWRSH